MMIWDFICGLKSRISWKLGIFTLFSLVFALAIFPLVKFADSTIFTENGIIENLQLFVLTVSIAICLPAKINKKLFYFVAMILVLLVMRETNLGRQYFCDKYLAPDELCRWKSFKYGFVMEALRGAFALYVILYALMNKLIYVIFDYVKNAPLYVVDFTLLVVGGVLGTIAEMPIIDNEILEECGELLFYFALFSAIYKYQKVELPIKNN